MNNITLNWNDYMVAAKNVVAEGCVLVKNEHSVLPFKKNEKVAIFGRIQNHYYKSGTGSGGMVNVLSVTTIPEALEKTETVIIDQDLREKYTEWEKENPFEQGVGWGMEPWFQKEMILSEDLVTEIASKNDMALVIIGRTAGEDKDCSNDAGSWLLSPEERDMLKLVRNVFDKVAVVLNVGSIIDMNFVNEYNIDSVLYCWQGGLAGEEGTAEVLTGKVSPSGKLTNTIAFKIEDYPSHINFGNPTIAKYEEDIYVGYRYFETAAQEKVMYPFGFGLSYTTFNIQFKSFTKNFDILSSENIDSATITVTTKVTNTGNTQGKEVVQLYIEQPQGLLGKPKKVLIGFCKTKNLLPNEHENISITINMKDLGSFDDTGITGFSNCSVLENGEYSFYIGNDVRNSKFVGKIELSSTIVTEKLHSALAPTMEIQRLKPVFENGKFSFIYETVKPSGSSQKHHRNDDLKQVQNEYSFENNTGSKEILRQLTDDDLCCIVRGEGMGSPKVTPGTAAAFGGVNKHLKELGIPCGCCSDGPSGLRLDSGAQAFSLPNGTMQACTFNTALVEELYSYLALEMVYNKIDILLGPGMNIHRYPLNGRNFEYFSEDPYITGMFASANIQGLAKAGVTGSLKHFCGNNQELGRSTINSVISQRALREIYLKGFEIAVKKGNATAIMTTYGAVNDIWTASSYDLNTIILRKEWGFNGIVMTDWWAKMNEEINCSNESSGLQASYSTPTIVNFAAMVRAQNDLYMVTQDASTNLHGDNLEESLKNGTLDRSELLRSANNIITFLQNTHSQKRLNGTEDMKVTIVNRIEAEDAVNPDDIVYYDIGGLPGDSFTISLENISTKRGNSFTFAINEEKPGILNLKLTAKSNSNSLAQMAVSIATNGTSANVLTFNGTNGKYVSKECQLYLWTKYTVTKLYFAESGLDLKDVTVSFIKPINGTPFDATTPKKDDEDA